MARKRSAIKSEIPRRKSKKIQAEIIGHNSDLRIYHANFKMSEDLVAQLLPGIMSQQEEALLEKASEATKKVVIGVKGIEGVLTFHLHLYSLFVEKAVLIDWEDIEPQIVGLIQMAFQEVLGEEVQHVKEYIHKHPNKMQMERDLKTALDIFNIYYPGSYPSDIE